uniref:Galectin n=1 Tax=Sinocyclocheilus anshuiensis TaxID=1608454 RepID=A0A671N8E8_9TELE
IQGTVRVKQLDISDEYSTLDTTSLLRHETDPVARMILPRADVAFHFNPRFSSSPQIVCNSLQHENWGREENIDLMPFKQGATFETIILVLCDVFKVKEISTTSHIVHRYFSLARDSGGLTFVSSKVSNKISTASHTVLGYFS